MNIIKEYPMTPQETYPPGVWRKGEKVKLKEDHIEVSNAHKHIAGKTLTVDKCFVKNLGSGVHADIVYFKKEKGVNNPYLSDYFEKI
jgi:hypothetical protein